MNRTPDSIPAVVLAGSDRKAGPVPPGAKHYRFLVGYKGAHLKIHGRPLIEILRERALESGCFSRVLVAGPKKIYEPLASGAVIDTDKDIGQNLRRVFRYCREEEWLCLLACDMLPAASDIEAAIRLWTEAGKPCFWFPLVEIPPEMGASDWKPKYGLRAKSGAPARPFLPGHIGILNLEAVRIHFLCKVSGLLYRLRNRELEHRRKLLYGFVLGDLLGQDLMNLLRGRWPTLTWRVIHLGWRLYSRLRKHTLVLEDMEGALTQLLIKSKFQKEGAVRFTPCGLLPLARDFDTAGEVEEHGGTWSGGEVEPKKRFLRPKRSE